MRCRRLGRQLARKFHEFDLLRYKAIQPEAVVIYCEG